MDIKATVIAHKMFSTVVMTENCTFEKISKDVSLPIGSETYIKQETKKAATVNRSFFFKALPAAGLVLAVAILAFLVPGMLPRAAQSDQVFAVIDVDINPCVSLSINKAEKVLHTSSLNEDGRKLLEELDLKGKDIKDAVATLMERARFKDFDASFVLISGALGDGEEGNLEQLLLSILESDKVKDFEIISRAVKVTTEIKNEAAKNGISLARQAAYLYANREGNAISLDEIKGKSSSDIFVILSGSKSPDGGKDNSAEVIEPAEPVKTEPPGTSEPVTEPAETKDPSKRRATVSAKTVGDSVLLSWNGVDPENFSYYKVVLSKSNANPAYPEDGYLEVISDASTTSYTVLSGASYNGGDFGGKVKAGESYFVSITAVYGDEAVKGNSVKITLPAPVETEPPKTEPPATEPPKTEPSASDKATVSAKVAGDGVRLTWNKVDSKNFVYYKVVLSKSNANPVYPEDGYIEVISDPNTTSYTVLAGTGYSGGDFGGKVKAGESYYASITAVYSDKKVKGNAVKITIPGTATTQPPATTKATVSAKVSGNGVKLTWNKVDSKNFVYYKVVLSKSNANPVYPEDGYIEVISDPNTTSYTVLAGMGYSGGDFGGKVKAGESYFASITAVYSDKKVKGNAVKITIPGTSEPEPPGVTKATVSAQVVGEGVKLTWNSVDAQGFVYYKVVLSKSNANPVYPEDGYITYIEDPNNTTYTINAGDWYNGGDFGGKVKAGESYWASVTAVYSDKKVKGNAVTITIPGEPEPQDPDEPTETMAIVSAKLEVISVKLDWNRVNSENFLYYKVVMSKNNPNPVYPDDGYLAVISDPKTTTYTYRVWDVYTNGDFEQVMVDVEYYVSITAVYTDKTVKGNSVRVMIPETK